MCDSICQPELVLFWDHADQNIPTKALKSIKAKIITSKLEGLFPSVAADISLRTGQVEASLGCNFLCALRALIDFNQEQQNLKEGAQRGQPVQNINRTRKKAAQ